MARKYHTKTQVRAQAETHGSLGINDPREHDYSDITGSNAPSISEEGIEALYDHADQVVLRFAEDTPWNLNL